MEEENEETTENTSVLLHYEPAREIFLRRQRRVMSESFSPSHMEEPLSCGSETWNNDQIDDFVRKLGFLEAQNADMDKSVKFFQQINQVNTYCTCKWCTKTYSYLRTTYICK